MTYKIATLALVALHTLSTSALPPCVCTRNLTPVCGSDGKTYGNPCLLDCEKYKGNEISIAKDGPCEGYQTVCFCTFEYKPVCGTDGVTYSNRCALECEQRKRTINVASEGECDAAKIAEPPCVCTDNIDEVCGTDGNTYDNACLLNCATAKSPTLGVDHKGKCDNSVKIATLPSLPNSNQPPCICTEELNEVCGSDGTTYANPCLLNCATINNPSLSVKSRGKCNKVNVVDLPQNDQPTCTCPRDMDPVCGTDGKTYNNECLLRCLGGQVGIDRHGPCDFARDG